MEYLMKKILLVIALLIVCAALEAPEDYQWSPNGVRSAFIGSHEGYGGMCSAMPHDITIHESSFSL
jgi:hypothetical protein